MDSASCFPVSRSPVTQLRTPAHRMELPTFRVGLLSDSPLWKFPPYMPSDVSMMTSNTVTRTVMSTHLNYPLRCSHGKSRVWRQEYLTQHGITKGHRTMMSHSTHGTQGTVSGLGFPFLPIDQHLLFIDIRNSEVKVQLCPSLLSELIHRLA